MVDPVLHFVWNYNGTESRPLICQWCPLFVSVVRVYVGLPSENTSKHVYTIWIIFVMWIFKAVQWEGGRVMVFNATESTLFSVMFVEDTWVPGENQRPSASHWQTLSHKVVSSTSRHEPWAGFKLTALVVIGTDCICIGSYKVNYLTITTMMASIRIKICSVWFCVCLIFDKSIYLHVP